MSRHLFLTLALLGLFFSVARAADEPKKNSDPLQGTWTAVSAEGEEKPLDDLKDHQIVFEGDKFTIKSKEGKVLFKGTYKLDANSKPAAIDFKHTGKSMKGKTWKGIYSLEGETLKLCDNGFNPKKARPEAFASAKDSGHVLVVFNRAK